MNHNQNIVYHFVWAPMRHKPCLIGRAAQRLHELIREKAEVLPVDVAEVRVLPDRVYVAVAASPTVAPHRIVCQFKAHSSHCLRHEFQEMTRIPTLWTRAYLVLAGEQFSPEQVLQLFEMQQPARRRPGRPRSCALRNDERTISNA